MENIELLVLLAENKTALSLGPEGICLYQKAVYNKESLPVAGASLFATVVSAHLH